MSYKVNICKKAGGEQEYFVEDIKFSDTERFLCLNFGEETVLMIDSDSVEEIYIKENK